MLHLSFKVPCDQCGVVVNEVVHEDKDIFCSTECLEQFFKDKQPPLISEGRVEEIEND